MPFGCCKSASKDVEVPQAPTAREDAAPSRAAQSAPTAASQDSAPATRSQTRRSDHATQHREAAGGQDQETHPDPSASGESTAGAGSEQDAQPDDARPSTSGREQAQPGRSADGEGDDSVDQGTSSGNASGATTQEREQGDRGSTANAMAHTDGPRQEASRPPPDSTGTGAAARKAARMGGVGSDPVRGDAEGGGDNTDAQEPREVLRWTAGGNLVHKTVDAGDAGGSGAAGEDEWPPVGGALAQVMDDESSLLRVALHDLKQQKALAAQHAEARQERQLKHEEREAELLELRRREAMLRAKEGEDESEETAAERRERAKRRAASQRECDIMEQLRREGRRLVLGDQASYYRVHFPPGEVRVQLVAPMNSPLGAAVESVPQDLHLQTAEVTALEKLESEEEARKARRALAKGAPSAGAAAAADESGTGADGQEEEEGSSSGDDDEYWQPAPESVRYQAARMSGEMGEWNRAVRRAAERTQLASRTRLAPQRGDGVVAINEEVVALRPFEEITRMLAALHDTRKTVTFLPASKYRQARLHGIVKFEFELSPPVQVHEPEKEEEEEGVSAAEVEVEATEKEGETEEGGAAGEAPPDTGLGATKSQELEEAARSAGAASTNGGDQESGSGPSRRAMSHWFTSLTGGAARPDAKPAVTKRLLQRRFPTIREKLVELEFASGSLGMVFETPVGYHGRGAQLKQLTGATAMMMRNRRAFLQDMLSRGLVPEDGEGGATGLDVPIVEPGYGLATVNGELVITEPFVQLLARLKLTGKGHRKLGFLAPRSYKYVMQDLSRSAEPNAEQHVTTKETFHFDAEGVLRVRNAMEERIPGAVAEEGEDDEAEEGEDDEAEEEGCGDSAPAAGGSGAAKPAR